MFGWSSHNHFLGNVKMSKDGVDVSVAERVEEQESLFSPEETSTPAQSPRKS